jgi:hypothetical protein
VPCDNDGWLAAHTHTAARNGLIFTIARIAGINHLFPTRFIPVLINTLRRNIDPIDRV